MILINSWNNTNLNLNKKKYQPTLVYNYDKTTNLKTDFNDSKSVDYIHDLRRAAECHRIVRKHIQNIIKPGMRIFDICNLIESKIVELTKVNDHTAGIAFPTGVSLNNIIAHDSANPNDDRMFGHDDICKIDFGVHYNGRIVDCAFSATFNEKYKPLLLATKEATWTGIRLAGPDAICNEISEQIKETIESHEIELNNKTFSLKAVSDLGGHSIDQYNIHSGKIILCAPCKHPSYVNMRMNVGQFAIETFASTGTGTYKHGDVINHYMLNENAPRINYNFKTTKYVHDWIKKNRGRLPFTQRWMINDPNIGQKFRLGLKELIEKKVITGYPPLYDVSGSLSSHMEHTIYLHEHGKEILSYGDDF
ncbi:metallopeptidase family M24 [Catovirus CTV1]|uniref:Metallopeptidase family M24 n=1 Tax=Catovirus CTV1 TaxID=1977631 RepID=A0A1V0SB15_9VIRU|nr:metallopeptidase family M24 [Catovirus CTV1]